MKILTGRFKNRELKTPKGQKTRPTSSKVKGSVFDILQNQILDAHFLDLFAGSGSMGIEALSRGAIHATFVEKDRAGCQCIRENVALLKLEDETTIVQSEITAALKRLIRNEERFDIIYIDPPYTLKITPLLEEIPKILKEEGLIILEQSKEACIQVATLNQVDKRDFGDTSLYFFIPLE